MRAVLRRRYFWVLLLAAVTAGWVTYRVMHPPWEGTEAWEKYEQIRLGMTREEAEAVLGQPSPFDVQFNLMMWWVGDGEVVVVFERQDQDRVVYKRVTIQDHELDDPPTKKCWLGRWGARLGL